ncbi:DUF7351 domain-containing protein [Haloarchaeobius amylolyticus]|uniref:DUF7351 domain-containing protein n=1 Tax=Haloarchaeobius amylolyticus TaxID=1198296 RepID=UPI002271CB9A|nr:hypothetical protein [Haloarchaeobius amylolyticus]
MTDDSGDRFDEETALSLLASEIRVDIIRALGEETVDSDGLGYLSYADLQRRVDVTDSGRFNYHLGELQGTFVREYDPGYGLTTQGRLAFQHLVGGGFTTDLRVNAFPVEQSCWECGNDLVAEYGYGWERPLMPLFFVKCWDCRAEFARTYVPPRGVATRSKAELLVAADRRNRMETASLVRGVCPWCAGHVDTTVHERDPDESLPASDDGRPLSVYYEHHCESCTGFHYTPIGETLRYHADVIAFYADHGHDLHTIPKWELEWAVTDHHLTWYGPNPWDLRVEIPLEGDVLRARLDEEATVLATEIV